MERFLTFYSKEVLPRLIEDIRKINEETEVFISDTEPCRSMYSPQDEEVNINTEVNINAEEVTQYKVVNGSNSYLRGLQAVKRKGVDYCVDQLSLGTEHFARITLGDYSQINECFLSFPWCEDEDVDNKNPDILNHYSDDSDNDSTSSDGEAEDDNDKELEQT